MAARAPVTWLGQTYGKQAGQPGYDPNLDFNCDNLINRTDFNQFIRHLTISYDTSAEPASAVMPVTTTSATLPPPLLQVALAQPASVSPAIIRKAPTRPRVDSISIINAMHRFRYVTPSRAAPVRKR